MLAKWARGTDGRFSLVCRSPAQWLRRCATKGKVAGSIEVVSVDNDIASLLRALLTLHVWNVSWTYSLIHSMGVICE